MDKGDIMGGGNPLKRVTGAVKQAGKDVGSTDWWEQTATSGLSSAANPGVWAAYAVNPTFGLGMGAKEAEQTYGEMSEAEREEAIAEAEAATAKAEEQRLMEEQRTAQQEQERMTSERAKEAELSARKRASRLGKGRRGLLYGGATGVKSDKSTVLGG